MLCALVVCNIPSGAQPHYTVFIPFYTITFFLISSIWLVPMGWVGLDWVGLGLVWLGKVNVSQPFKVPGAPANKIKQKFT